MKYIVVFVDVNMWWNN